MSRNRLILLFGFTSLCFLIGNWMYWKYGEEQKQIEIQRQLDAQRKWEAEYPTLYLKNGNYSVQIGMYEFYKSRRVDIVMFGNSHTYLANWNEILNRKSLVNRGIVSDVTAGYLHRLKYVYDVKPKICFLEGGVNDIYANYRQSETLKNFRLILDTLDMHKIRVVVSSTFLVSAKWPNAIEKNREIRQLNDSLSFLCGDRKIDFLDINPLITIGGFLKEELTYDGIHLNAVGYSAWAPKIDSILLKYKL